MTEHFTITIAQTNPTVGDLVGNTDKIKKIYAEHKSQADIVAFSEMVVTGYPVEDLVLKPFFIDRVMQSVDELATVTAGTGAALLVSAPWRVDGKVYNAALLLQDGKVTDIRFKHNLPNYGVFDEARVFTPGPLPTAITVKGARIGILTCEDMWFPEVAASLKNDGAEILIAMNGSPFEVDKSYIRQNHAHARAAETGLPLIYINQVGGQDELVFDGGSFAIDPSGKVLTQLPTHTEYVSTTVWQKSTPWVCKSFEAPHDVPAGLASIYATLVLGLRDYVRKNGFPGVLLGMSGGIDSALSAAIAVDALGADKVRCVMMPSPYTSQESLDDAAACSGLLGVSHGSVGIAPAMAAFDDMLKSVGNDNSGITAENLQARSRGVLLMALSNASGAMVLSTGNKSEMSVGYATLYGDMCGGYNALKDVYKTIVFQLCHWRNENMPAGALGPKGRVIPERIITKPPSAELRPDQKDEDSLPPYDALDDILQCLVEEEMSLADIVARGHAPETVNRVWKLLDRAEYKRRQACPGVKISRRAFGRDRRYPIVNKFNDIVVK